MDHKCKKCSTRLYDEEVASGFCLMCIPHRYSRWHGSYAARWCDDHTEEEAA